MLNSYGNFIFFFFFFFFLLLLLLLLVFFCFTLSFILMISLGINLLRAFDHICMEKARYKFLIIIIIIIIIISIIIIIKF